MSIFAFVLGKLDTEISTHHIVNCITMNHSPVAQILALGSQRDLRKRFIIWRKGGQILSLEIPTIMKTTFTILSNYWLQVSISRWSTWRAPPSNGQPSKNYYKNWRCHHPPISHFQFFLHCCGQFPLSAQSTPCLDSSCYWAVNRREQQDAGHIMIWTEEFPSVESSMEKCWKIGVLAWSLLCASFGPALPLHGCDL